MARLVRAKMRVCLKMFRLQQIDKLKLLCVKVQFTFFVFLVTIVHEKSILALKSTHIFPPTVSLTFKLAHESYIYIFKVQVLHSNRNLETTRQEGKENSGVWIGYRLLFIQHWRNPPIICLLPPLLLLEFMILNSACKIHEEHSIGLEMDFNLKYF